MGVIQRYNITWWHNFHQTVIHKHKELTLFILLLYVISERPSLTYIPFTFDTLHYRNLLTNFHTSSYHLLYCRYHHTSCPVPITLSFHLSIFLCVWKSKESSRPPPVILCPLSAQHKQNCRNVDCPMTEAACSSASGNKWLKMTNFPAILMLENSYCYKKKKHDKKNHVAVEEIL